MLILAPKPLDDDNSATSINIHIATRLKLFHMGQIKTLWEEAMSIASRKKPTDRPPTGRNDDRAAQHAADYDNWRTANARLYQPQMIAPIGTNNFGSVRKLYAKKYDLPPPNPSFTSVPYNPSKIHHLPGNISKSILKRPKGSGTGVMTDYVDTFINLIKLGNKELNDDIHDVFDLVYRNAIPPKISPYFTDTYLFCFFKDPDNPTKLRPIGIPSAMRRILAGHVSAVFRHQFATPLLLYNWAIGVHQDMDFIIKAMQLSVKKYIIIPQSKDQAPSRAAVFLDLKICSTSCHGTNYWRPSIASIPSSPHSQTSSMATQEPSISDGMMARGSLSSWKRESIKAAPFHPSLLLLSSMKSSSPLTRASVSELNNES